MLGGGECTRQGSAATDVTEDGAFEDVGQHGKRAGSVREPRRLGDKHKKKASSTKSYYKTQE